MPRPSKRSQVSGTRHLVKTRRSRDSDLSVDECAAGPADPFQVSWLDLASLKSRVRSGTNRNENRLAEWKGRIAGALADRGDDAMTITRWLESHALTEIARHQMLGDSLDGRLFATWQILCAAVVEAEEQRRDEFTAADVADAYEAVSLAAVKFAQAIDAAATRGLRLPLLCSLYDDDSAESLLKTVSRAWNGSRDAEAVDSLLNEVRAADGWDGLSLRAGDQGAAQFRDAVSRRRYGYAQYLPGYALSPWPEDRDNADEVRFLLADTADLMRAYALRVRAYMAEIDRRTNSTRRRKQSRETGKRPKGEAEKLEAERLEKIHLVDIRARMITGRVIDFFCRAFDTAAIPHTVIAACVRLTVRVCYDQDRPDMDRNYVQKIYETKKRARRSPATGRGRKKVNRSE